MLRSDEAHISALIMLITAIAQSVCVCELMCERERKLVMEAKEG